MSQRKTRKQTQKAQPSDSENVEVVDASETDKVTNTQEHAPNTPETTSANQQVTQADDETEQVQGTVTPVTPSERPTPGLSTANFPLAGSTAQDSQSPKQPKQMNMQKVSKRLFHKDELGACTVRVGHLSGEAHSLKIPIDQLGYQGCEYVVQFQHEVGSRLPVASIPPTIAQILRRQRSASRNFAFHLA